MKQTTCGIIKSYLTEDIKYHVTTETSAKNIWETLESKYLIKSIDNHLHLKRRFYRFQLKNRISIGEHMNNYKKLFADLANIDEMIKDEDKALIQLSSLLGEEYETFVLTLINGKRSNVVSATLVNHEVRRKDKVSSSSSTTAGVWIAREISFNY